MFNLSKKVFTRSFTKGKKIDDEYWLASIADGKELVIVDNSGRIVVPIIADSIFVVDGSDIRYVFQQDTRLLFLDKYFTQIIPKSDDEYDGLLKKLRIKKRFDSDIDKHQNKQAASTSKQDIFISKINALYDWNNRTKDAYIVKKGKNYGLVKESKNREDIITMIPTEYLCFSSQGELHIFSKKTGNATSVVLYNVETRTVESVISNFTSNGKRLYISSIQGHRKLYINGNEVNLDGFEIDSRLIDSFFTYTTSDGYKGIMLIRSIDDKEIIKEAKYDEISVINAEKRTIQLKKSGQRARIMSLYEKK